MSSLRIGTRVICGVAAWMPLAVSAQEPSATASDQTAEEPAQSEGRLKPKRLSTREQAAARRTAREAAARGKQAEERREWLARLEARGVEPWPEAETDERHANALAKSREMVDDVISLFPGTQLYETEHFLFTSNIPPEQVAPYVVYLDKMHQWMCELYGVPRGHKLWLGGKAPIFAFLAKEQFDAFEERHFPEARASLRSLANIYGLCHQGKDGQVVIACYRGNDPHDFGQMLVHETSHGFIYRYKTKAQLPNWVDEGMADLIGAEMVPASQTVRNRELRAVQLLAQQRSLGGMLSAKRIDGWQYGAASNLNRFLLQANRASYVRFIEGLKEGMKWDEALGAAYGSTPDEMLAHHGRWIGVADLRP